MAAPHLILLLHAAWRIVPNGFRTWRDVQPKSVFEVQRELDFGAVGSVDARPTTRPIGDQPAERLLGLPVSARCSSSTACRSRSAWFFAFTVSFPSIGSHCRRPAGAVQASSADFSSSPSGPWPSSRKRRYGASHSRWSRTIGPSPKKNSRPPGRPQWAQMAAPFPSASPLPLPSCSWLANQSATQSSCRLTEGHLDQVRARSSAKSGIAHQAAQNNSRTVKSPVAARISRTVVNPRSQRQQQEATRRG
jgi:hypothetical protein